KLMLAPHATPTLALMTETALLGNVLGGVALLASFENMVKVEAAVGGQSDPGRGLGALGGGGAEERGGVAQRARLFHGDGERLTALEGWWRVSPERGGRSARALLYRMGPQHFVDQVLIAWSRSAAGAADRAWRALAELPRKWSAPEFPLKAADFMAR